MKYLKKYESHEDIRSICQKYDIENYKINDDGSIDVDGNIYLAEFNLAELPLNFRNISGFVNCNSNRLTSLEGCPKSIGGSFACGDNKLTSLKGCPKSVGGGFSCSDNLLTSLEGCPKSVGGNFYCIANRLTSNKLTSLEGCPKSVGVSLNCRWNEIETFEGLDFTHIGYSFYCDGNPIWCVWRLFQDHTKFEFFNDCDIIRENRVIILDRLNFFLDYIGKDTVTGVKGYKCI
jgi:hypothetical protein